MDRAGIAALVIGIGIEIVAATVFVVWPHPAGIISGGLLGSGVALMLIGLALLSLTATRLQFSVRECTIDIPHFDLDTPQQPFRTLELIASGQLTNGASRKAVVEKVAVRLRRKQLIWWRKVCDADPLLVLGEFRANLDLKFHTVQIDGDSRHSGISELRAYFSIPKIWSLNELAGGKYRVTFDVFPVAQRKSPGTRHDFDLHQVLESAQGARRRLEKFREGKIEAKP